MLGTIPSMQRHPFWITICLLVLLDYVLLRFFSRPEIDRCSFCPSFTDAVSAGRLCISPSSVPTFDSQNFPHLLLIQRLFLKMESFLRRQVSSSNNDRSSIIHRSINRSAAGRSESASTPAFCNQGHKFSTVICVRQYGLLADVVFEYYAQQF